MGETPKFFFLVSFAAVLVSSFILRSHTTENSRAMARRFYYICIVLSSAALLLSVLSSFGALHGEVYARVFRILVFRAWVVAGTALSAAIIVLLNATDRGNSRVGSPGARDFVSSPFVFKGICLSVAIAFICTEIGKVVHDAEMREFFLQSGYAVWFLYFVITCEVLGAIGLMIQRTAVPAAAGLSLLMMGAIGTHVHNGDPVSDSLDAIHLLILLTCILVIRTLGKKVSSATLSKQSAFAKT